METLAIIINSYKNNPEYLKTAIRSCLAQTDVEIKLIVSTVEGDSAETIAKAENSSIVIVKSQSPGIYEQLNKAIPETFNCEYFHYFSGNDYCEPSKAQDEIGIIKSCNKKVCYSNYHYANAYLKIDGITNFKPYDYKRHLSGNFIPDWSIMQTSILKKYFPFQIRHVNDAYYDFWLRVAESEGNVFAFNPKAEVRYRITSDSKHILRKKNPKEKARYAHIREVMLAEHGKGLGKLP